MNIFRTQHDIDKSLCQIHTLPEIYYDYFGNLIDGYFVEIGAFDCKQWSNTFMLVELGWGGIYVEPSLEFFKRCIDRDGDNPKIELVNIAIGKEVRVAKLFLGGSLTTIKEEAVDAYNEIGWSQSSGLNKEDFVECIVVTLDNLLRAYKVKPNFDVLIIDVEGAEEDVMKGFSLEVWKPKMAIVEAHEKSPENTLNWKAAMFDKYFVEQNGYQKIHADSINNIYVKS